VAAKAATPHATKVGDSEIANPGTLSNASRQLFSLTLEFELIMNKAADYAA